jgi:hypothetical protein
VFAQPYGVQLTAEGVDWVKRGACMTSSAARRDGPPVRSARPADVERLVRRAGGVLITDPAGLASLPTAHRTQPTLEFCHAERVAWKNSRESSQIANKSRIAT